MFKKLAKKITSFMINHNIVQGEERDIYEYSFEVLIAGTVGFGLIFLLAIIFGEFLFSLFFLLGFFCMRKLSGGYHANNHLSCLLISLGLFCSFLALIKVLSRAQMMIGITALACLSLVLVFIFSPAQDANKPFTPSQHERFYKRSRIFIMAVSFITAVPLATNFLIEFVFSFWYGVFAVALSLLMAKVKEKKLAGNQVDFS